MAAWGRESVNLPTFDQLSMVASLRFSRLLPVGREYNHLITGTFAALDTTRIDLQDQGGTKVLPTSAAPVEVIATGGNDTISGTGAQIVLVSGLPDDLTAGGGGTFWQQEIVLMPMAGSVFTTQLFRRVIEARVVQSGSLRRNDAPINFDISGDTQVQIGVGPDGVGNGISSSMAVTVPDGWTGHIQGIDASWSGANSAFLYFCAEISGTRSCAISEEIKSSRVLKAGLIGLPGRLDILAEVFRTGAAGGSSTTMGARVGILFVRD